jgi:hypothetical protein
MDAGGAPAMVVICQERHRFLAAKRKVMADLNPEFSTTQENKGLAANAQETKVTQPHGTTGARR